MNHTTAERVKSMLGFGKDGSEVYPPLAAPEATRVQGSKVEKIPAIKRLNSSTLNVEP
jgi:hypothetical protein